jgi:DNA invertase Pin-like site-specific DNA recombinase
VGDIACVKILAMGMDTSTANGRLMLNVLGSVAQFEREMMLELDERSCRRQE